MTYITLPSFVHWEACEVPQEAGRIISWDVARGLFDTRDYQVDMACDLDAVSCKVSSIVDEKPRRRIRVDPVRLSKQQTETEAQIHDG